MEGHQTADADDMSRVTRYLSRGNEMRRKLAMVTVLAVLGVVAAGSALAGQPEEPGCFGKDRAAALHVMQAGGAPGASEWGAIARERAGENGAINRDYKESCGGSPS
jgi:hypothetical protein